MNWDNKNWEEEDAKFAPKRKVNNKASHQLHNIMGAFYSYKMNRVVEHESLNEWLFYSLLELDNATKRYYPQPVAIDIPYTDEDGNKKTWSHISDVLVFRQGMMPVLYQVKEKQEENKKNSFINKICSRYTEERGWGYCVIYPKKLPKTALENINFLMAFTKHRSGFDILEPKLIEQLSEIGSTTIIDLAERLQIGINVMSLLPAIYHLIATGVFYTSISKKINQSSEIKIIVNEGLLEGVLNEIYEIEK